MTINVMSGKLQPPPAPPLQTPAGNRSVPVQKWGISERNGLKSEWWVGGEQLQVTINCFFFFFNVFLRRNLDSQLWYLLTVISSRLVYLFESQSPHL